MSKDIFEAIKDKSVEEALGIYLKGNTVIPNISVFLDEMLFLEICFHL